MEQRYKENEKIDFPKALPNPGTMRTWWPMARASVMSATNRPDQIFVWFEDILRRSFNSLNDPAGFEQLDWKLKQAIQKIAHGDLGARMFEREEEMAMEHKIYRGRQMLKDVIRWHSGEDAEALMHDLEDYPERSRSPQVPDHVEFRVERDEASPRRDHEEGTFFSQ